MESLPTIPTPTAQRWREFRIQILPLVVFLIVLTAIVFMWRTFVQPAGVVGEVEAVKANVISLLDGQLVELSVERFQTVTNGQVLGQVVNTDPELLRASVEAAKSDLLVLHARMKIDESRHDQNYQQLRLDLLNEKQAVAIAQANLILATNNLWRIENLHKSRLASDQELDIEKANVHVYLTEITSRSKTIEDLENALHQFEKPRTETSDPVIQEAIKAKEAELEQLMKPTLLKAPMDGVVTFVYRRANERVVRGEPLVTISALNPEHIVGYIRQPVQKMPTTNDTVVIRTRSNPRRVADAQILKVGSLFEPINPVLITTDSNHVEVGLPILVGLPQKMNLTPGEFVDLSIRYAKR